MIVDSRHAPTADDVTMAGWFMDTGRPLTVLANKCDKLKKSELAPNLELIRDTLGLDAAVPLIAFSAQKGTGRDKLLTEISRAL
jgi:GTP-binding protein